MKILIIEDDEPKMNAMSEFILSCTECQHAEIIGKKSYQSGLAEVMTNPPDMLFLDMSIPTYDRCPEDPKGGRPRPFGGRDILREVYRKNLETKVAIVTQFAVLKDSDKEEKTLEELTTTFDKEFPDHFLGIVFYRHSENSWQAPLKKLVDEFLKLGESEGV